MSTFWVPAPQICPIGVLSRVSIRSIADGSDKFRSNEEEEGRGGEEAISIIAMKVDLMNCYK